MSHITNKIKSTGKLRKSDLKGGQKKTEYTMLMPATTIA
jgi:hypothetical protein